MMNQEIKLKAKVKVRTGALGLSIPLNEVGDIIEVVPFSLYGDKPPEYFTSPKGAIHKDLLEFIEE